MVLGAPDRVIIPCLKHDTRPCKIDVKMTKTLSMPLWGFEPMRHIHRYANSIVVKVEENKEPSFEPLIYPYGVVLFNIFLPYAHSFEL